MGIILLLIKYILFMYKRILLSSITQLIIKRWESVTVPIRSRRRRFVIPEPGASTRSASRDWLNLHVVLETWVRIPLLSTRYHDVMKMVV